MKILVMSAAATAMLLVGMAMTSSAGAQSAPNGEQLFRQRCATCHSIDAGQPARLGPNLAGVSGRRAAGSAGFAYSPALRASGLSWDRPTLDRYLAAPTRAVPGSRMVIAVTDARQRAAIIDYLTRR